VQLVAGRVALALEVAQRLEPGLDFTR
jgi:hypothetical protein